MTDVSKAIDDHYGFSGILSQVLDGLKRAGNHHTKFSTLAAGSVALPDTLPMNAIAESWDWI